MAVLVKRLLTLLVFLGLCSCLSAQGFGIRLVDVIPFGPMNGDSELPEGNDAAMTVALETPLSYYGELRYNITVNLG